MASSAEYREVVQCGLDAHPVNLKELTTGGEESELERASIRLDPSYREGVLPKVCFGRQESEGSAFDINIEQTARD